MAIQLDEISIKGKFIEVPAIKVDDVTVVSLGKWIKTAYVKSETWLDGAIVANPVKVIEKIKKEKLPADIFTFSQKLPDIQPEFEYPFVWDNIAAIPIKDFDDWWMNKLSKWTRKNIRRSARRGVAVKEATFDAQLIKGIMEINNDTPYRNARPFWHYGKSFEQVKKDYESFPDRSGFFGAYYEEQLIGILKLVYMKDAVSILQILCKSGHADKRPANALISKAVEVASHRKAKYLVYGKYIYNEGEEGALTEFKRRNAFEKFLAPTYYVPITIKGMLLVKLKLYLGIKSMIPKSLMPFIRRQRGKYYQKSLISKEK